MAAEMAVTTCEWLHLLEQFDRVEGWAGDGLLSCAHWLSWTCSVSPGTARNYLRVARALPGLPLIDAAFAAGRLSYSKVRAIIRIADRVDERVLLEQATVQTVSQLERTVRQFRRLDGDGLAQRRRRRATWRWDDDGMLVLSARLPPDEGALLIAALEQIRNDHDGRPELPACPESADESAHRSEESPDRSESADRLPDLPPTDRDSDADGIAFDADLLAFSGADALVALAEKALAVGDVDSSGDDRHLLILHADLDLIVEPGETTESEPPESNAGAPATASAEGRAGQRCHLEDGPGVDRETAQRIACDAALVAVLHHVGIGEPLRLGRKTRTISPAQRRALRVRDGGCRFPGCHRRRFLEAHHVRYWSRFGPTDLDNLVLVCRVHHMLVHEGGFHLAARPGGGWIFRTPEGREIPGSPGAIPLGRSAGRAATRNPDDLLPGWSGEPFHLWATVAALQDNRRISAGNDQRSGTSREPSRATGYAA